MSKAQMSHQIGKQYDPDDGFKAAARLHQSQYRAHVLNVDYDEYGNRLKYEDAVGLLNYYDGLNVRKAREARCQTYSRKRDADMLRSEHIPFNLFAPLVVHRTLARALIQNAFGIGCREVQEIWFEYAPKPKECYLNDGTAFDVYIQYLGENKGVSGIGIEVKYTEKEYRIGVTEKRNVENQDSHYWRVTRASKAFMNDADPILGSDALRQIWRNHLLGLAMLGRREICEFTSVILYPEGNRHFAQLIPEYRALMRESHRQQVCGCTYETFIVQISGDEGIEKWKDYLKERYLVNQDAAGRLSNQASAIGSRSNPALI